MENSTLVTIVMATYNAEKYIEDQINSILLQTYTNFILYIRDDGSSDKTINIIQSYIKKDNRISLIVDNICQNGPGNNFKNIIKHCKSDYVLFSDQDDVWFPDKISKLVKYAELNFDSKPSIVYSPGIVTDENLQKTNIKTDYKNHVYKLSDVLLKNGGIQGCAMLINKELYKLALNHDFSWHMHDQVLTLYAVTFGKVYYIEEPSFYYRQHSNNVVGFNNLNIKDKFIKYIFNKNVLIDDHSKILFKLFFYFENKNIPLNDRIILKHITSDSNKSFVNNLIFIIKNKITLRGSVILAILKLCLFKRIL